MRSVDRGSTQRGYVLLVAMVSVLTVGAVAAGLNALIGQDAETFNQTIRAMKNTSVSDALRSFSCADTSINLDLYNDQESFIDRVSSC